MTVDVEARGIVGHREKGDAIGLARSTRRACLADPLGAKLRLQRGRLDMRADDVRHLERHRHQVVGHVAVEKLPVGPVDAFLE